MERIRVLDIGIGKGGRYLEQDTRHTLRIGFDNRVDSLITLSGSYPRVRGLIGDANLSGRVYLPLRPSSFDQVDIILPFDKLLIALVDRSNSLWEELHRVIRPRGYVRAIVDCPEGGVAATTVGSISTLFGGDIAYIANVQEKVASRARQAGFTTRVRRMVKRELKTLGTDYARAIQHSSVYEVIARPGGPKEEPSASPAYITYDLRDIMQAARRNP